MEKGKHKIRKKVLEISDCEDCIHHEEYERGSLRCREAERWVRVAGIPKWCPLEDSDKGE